MSQNEQWSKGHLVDEASVAVQICWCLWFGLLVETVVPITRKILPWDKVRASTCMVVTYVQRINYAYFFSCISFQRLQNSAIPRTGDLWPKS